MDLLEARLERLETQLCNEKQKIEEKFELTCTDLNQRITRVEATMGKKEEVISISELRNAYLHHFFFSK